MNWSPAELQAGVRAGDRRALARAISLVEDGEPEAYELVRALYPDTGNAYAVGVTGPPGVGKSSLISALVRHVRGLDLTVGVVSVDPSSPFTQGALLGDRILLDASGKDLVFLETVGTGQSEIEVIAIADTVLLVLMPGSGDSIQALKAGIMEIPDVIAVNKMDHPAAKTMLNEVRSILSLDRAREWRPPIVLTEATRGENVPELWARIEEHRAHLEEGDRLAERRRQNLRTEVFAVASARAKGHLERAVAGDEELRRLLDEVGRRELDPLTAVQEIMQKVFRLDDGNDPDTR